ncbi:MULTISPECIES: C40 family peptidase [Pseudomonas]|uniref:Peptidoglycan endopeptidase n=2 Tax=Pseudomonas TaxID=286 RepID=A0AAD0LCR9_PSEPU|nr:MULTISPECIES: C40 family peptidase [Pseudomonas]ANC04567.1 hydrolase Nlp/P60 [Pseudomonas putida]AXA26304.1 peptidoglycan endopeptidase [Pseudomonas putida]KAB5624075.1 NlpC/P60 family protein [Pseudomonas putida]MBK0058615.1 C40 family peptidase [Pseudomonas sp. S44]MEA5674517.1 C40 family peptidase [Pseudomonas sp. MH2]
MAMMTRFAFLSLVALLAACSSRAPAPAPVAKPQITFIDQPSSSPVADDVLIRAIGLVGTPYRWGGNTPDSGFDCSGLIGYVYRDAANINLPRSTREMIVMRAPTVDINSLQSGDLVFFATGGGSQVSHAGIYVGEGRFVHAPSTGGTVRLDYLSNSYWSKAYLQAKRVLAPGHLAQNP